jgi:HEAT repeat protein
VGAWQAERQAAGTLVAFGLPAARRLMSTAEDEESSSKVRRSCYYWLRDAFPRDDFVRATIIRSGLSDADATIRYECAFFLGEQKVYGGFRQLRRALEQAKSEDYVGLAAAKSLAQLGEADVLPILYKALGSDRYMDRSMANRGIKGLTGKGLNDFDYDYSEGAFVSGGHEYVRLGILGIEDAERRARRFGALARYCRWLKQARPEYYKYLDAAY